jgi:hypothetical protein
VLSGQSWVRSLKGRVARLSDNAKLRACLKDSDPEAEPDIMPMLSMFSATTLMMLLTLGTLAHPVNASKIVCAAVAEVVDHVAQLVDVEWTFSLVRGCPMTILNRELPGDLVAGLLHDAGIRLVPSHCMGALRNHKVGHGGASCSCQIQVGLMQGSLSRPDPQMCTDSCAWQAQFGPRSSIGSRGNAFS